MKELDLRIKREYGVVYYQWQDALCWSELIMSHVGDSSSEEGDDGIECVACDKIFKNEKSFVLFASVLLRRLVIVDIHRWESHQRSKKHLKAVAVLKAHMKAEDALLQQHSKEGSEEDTEYARYI